MSPYSWVLGSRQTVLIEIDKFHVVGRKGHKQNKHRLEEWEGGILKMSREEQHSQTEEMLRS